jgi:hypothetical protein
VQHADRRVAFDRALVAGWPASSRTVNPAGRRNRTATSAGFVQRFGFVPAAQCFADGVELSTPQSNPGEASRRLRMVQARIVAEGDRRPVSFGSRHGEPASEATFANE